MDTLRHKEIAGDVMQSLPSWGPGSKKYFPEPGPVIGGRRSKTWGLSKGFPKGRDGSGRSGGRDVERALRSVAACTKALGLGGGWGWH